MLSQRRKEKKCILVAGRVGSAHRGYMMVIDSRWAMSTLQSYKNLCATL